MMNMAHLATWICCALGHCFVSLFALYKYWLHSVAILEQIEGGCIWFGLVIIIAFIFFRRGKVGGAPPTSYAASPMAAVLLTIRIIVPVV